MSGEFALIDKLSGWFDPSEDVEVGIGDDAAVLAEGAVDLVTIDTLVEDVHFRREWCEAGDVGWKLAAANLSDVAAMGARPSAFVLSLALPPSVDDRWVEGFCAGIGEAVDAMVPRPAAVSAAGGDLSSTSGPAVVTMTLLGEVAPAGPIRRDGASAGDRIVVSGVPGRSAAGLAVLHQGGDPGEHEQLMAAYRRPQARVSAGRRLGLEAIPSAMIDVSDGLLQDLGHILEASGVGARVDLSGLAVPDQLNAAERAGFGRVREWIGTGGEDLCLLATIPPQRYDRFAEDFASDGDRWYCIGEVQPGGQGLEIIGPEGRVFDESTAGFRHFEES